MSNRDPKEASILAATLARESRKVSAFRCARDAEALIALGKRAGRIAEIRCNGVPHWDSKAGRMITGWDEADEARADKQAAAIVAKARDILEPYGATRISASGDPRGYVLRFKLKSGASNGMGEGWGV